MAGVVHRDFLDIQEEPSLSLPSSGAYNNRYSGKEETLRVSHRNAQTLELVKGAIKSQSTQKFSTTDSDSPFIKSHEITEFLLRHRHRPLTGLVGFHCPSIWIVAQY